MPMFDPTTASRAVLIEVVNVLGAFRNDIVLVGGWVPDLLFPDCGHQGSLDVDLAISPAAVSSNAYETLCRRLLDAHYRHQSPPTHFLRDVQGVPKPVKVDLISGEYHEGNKLPAVRVNELHLSMGISLLVSAETKRLEAAVRWGDYQQEVVTEEVDGTQRKRFHYHRQPRLETVTVELPDVTAEPLELAVPKSDGLQLSVIVWPVHGGNVDGGLPSTRSRCSRSTRRRTERAIPREFTPPADSSRSRFRKISEKSFAQKRLDPARADRVPTRSAERRPFGFLDFLSSPCPTSCPRPPSPQDAATYRPCREIRCWGFPGELIHLHTKLRCEM